MTWTTTISEAEAAGELTDAYSHIEHQNGSVSNMTGTASINPRVMRALAGLLNALRGPQCVLGNAVRR